MADATATVPAPVTPAAAVPPAAATVTPSSTAPVTPPAGAAATPATPPAVSPAASPSLLGADGAAPVAAAPAKPDYSKLKLPDGTKLKPEQVDAFKAAAEKRGITAEAAQAEVDAMSGAVGTYHEGLIKSHQSAVAENRKRVEDHPTLGGANLKATDEAVTQVFTQFAPKGLLERVQQAGYQWDPDFLQMLVNIRASTKSDTFVPTGGMKPQGAPKTLESMYETKKK